MKNFNIKIGSILIIILAIISCANSLHEDQQQSIEHSKEFHKYWYSNEAEITGYSLEQARYGEIHTGTATTIFVTEPFSTTKQVKTDKPRKDEISVIKLNLTKKFLTGIYPYSMMSSTFTPVDYPDAHALKTTTSSQEWCGQTFTQLNNRDEQYHVSSYSYFEDQGDRTKKIKEAWLEDEIWTKIRLNPELLPLGDFDMIPSVFYIRMMHKELKTYKVIAKKTALNPTTTSYSISYPELDRTLTINYASAFPFLIESWTETYISGWGKKAQKLTTTATKLKTIKLDYWNKHGVKDRALRKGLGL